MYRVESLCCVPETNATLCVSYSQRKKKLKDFKKICLLKHLIPLRVYVDAFVDANIYKSFANLYSLCLSNSITKYLS